MRAKEPRRRNRSKLERRRIVEESLKPDASVASVARAHGVRANQIFHWRKLYREGRLDSVPSELLPVHVSEKEPHSSGIRIEFGSVRIRIEGSVRITLEHNAQ